MQTYKLLRSCNVPLEFDGELIACADGHFHRGREQNYWIDLRLYRTRAGTFVGERVVCANFKGQSDRREVLVFQSFTAAKTALAIWDPDELKGFAMPPGPAFERKRNGLYRRLREIYAERYVILFPRDDARAA
jgi:hypothetical protein